MHVLVTSWGNSRCNEYCCLSKPAGIYLIHWLVSQSCKHDIGKYFVLLFVATVGLPKLHDGVYMPIPAVSTSHAHFAPNTAGETGCANHITRSGVQPPNYTNRTVTLALAPNSSILIKPHTPPLILVDQSVSRQRTYAIYAAPPPAVATDELTPST
jgi:hypothetical protein